MTMVERKKYKLRSARRPRKHALLSGVVVVGDWQGKGTAYISFDESFVDAVGKALPLGVSPSHPAYLKVIHMPGRKTWRVFAMYLLAERGVLLWETDTRPHWIENVKIG